MPPCAAEDLLLSQASKPVIAEEITVEGSTAKSLAYLKRCLEPPSYGWVDTSTGKVYIPTSKELVIEFFKRSNIFTDRRHWLAAWSWYVMTLGGLVPWILYWRYYASVSTFAIWFMYAMCWMGANGTLTYHRYFTHHAFSFAPSMWGKLWETISMNLAIRVVPIEIYAVSHHVHHSIADMAGDPYCAEAGALYVFLADAIHQPIRKDLSRQEYATTVQLLAHCPMKFNTYEEYQKWGTVQPPSDFIQSSLCNWMSHYAIYYMIGGHCLAVTCFAATAFWMMGIRTFNYDSHSQGEEDTHVPGIDFHTRDTSVNQMFPGTMAGEWHNNHHLFPRSARTGFEWWQLDLPFYWVYLVSCIGGICKYKDDKPRYWSKYKTPYLKKLEEQRKSGEVPTTSAKNPYVPHVWHLAFIGAFAASYAFIGNSVLTVLSVP